MRRSGLRTRSTGVALAGIALALGGALVATSPAHALDVVDVDTEAELNYAIGEAVANPSDPVSVQISGDFSITATLSPLTAGSLTINGNGHTISASTVAAAGFDVSGASSLTINGLTFDFDDSGPIVTANGALADPTNSPTVNVSGVYATTGSGLHPAFDLADTAFSATTTTIHDSDVGIAGIFSFGTISLQDFTVLDAADCGIEVYLTEDSVLTADRLTIRRADCTALSLYATESGSATITNSLFEDSGSGVVIFNQGTGTIEVSDSTVSGSTAAEGFAAFAFTGTTRLTDSTITGGQDSGYPAVSAFIGDGDVIVSHSTVTGNAVSASPVFAAGGSCGCGGTGAFVLDHTIVAGNPGTGAGAPDLLVDSDPGAPSSVAWSLIGTVDPGDAATLALVEDPAGHNLFDATTPIDPDLGALGLNGGTTPNHLPNATSPVINAGDPAITGAPATDQRGSARISGGIIDIGSVEVQFTPSLVLSRTTTAVGDQVTATGAGFPPDTVYTIVFNSAPVTLGTATSNASGSFSFAFAVPASASAEMHTITAALGAVVLASAAIEVTGLPDTGSSDTPAATVIGALLLLAGAGTIAFSRRRRA